jgi:hypothetical protein
MLHYLVVRDEASVKLRNPDLAWKSLRLVGIDMSSHSKA